MVHMLTLALIGLATARQNVKVYINECYEELTLNDYHNFTGSIIVPPPDKIESDTSVMIEYEYARFPGIYTLHPCYTNVNQYIYFGQSLAHYWMQI